VEDRIEAHLTEHHAIFDARELRAVVLEQTAGEMPPDVALGIAREMVRDRRILTLEGGRMTTLAIRAQEQAIERRVAELAQPAGRDAGERARQGAVREVAERIAAPLSPEQLKAVKAVTGPERLAVLIGPAGTGKGVVIDAAARAEQHAGRTVLGIAVSGSTAERLGADSPALAGRTLTLDSLVARAHTGSIDVDQSTTIFLDEAGMTDHHRLDALTRLVERSGAKLIAVGDGKQLPSIGPGGMFDRLSGHAPTAELQDVYRTRDPGEQRAWQALRAGEPERAMAHYVLRNQLHFQDTRDEAGEAAVQRWHTLTQQHGVREVALIADASNQEIDRLNARAQHLRAQHGELGQHQVQHPDVHYPIHEGDLIAFTSQHRLPGQPRVENGTRGEITAIHPRGVRIALDGSDRHVNLPAEALGSIRLGYAQHVYRQQGATVQRSVVLTGGWQTSKESAYVQATRARHGTDWFLARDQLGLEGQDPDRVRRLAEHLRHSRSQIPSLAHPVRPEPDWSPSRDPLRIHRILSPTRWLTRALRRDTPERSTSRGR
jgi:ATP-dependent exoDNAse (exonuclease V) alpha subunit